MVGLMATSSKSGYAILKSATLSYTQVCCTEIPDPCGSPLLSHTFTGDTQTVLSQSLWDLWVPVCTRFVWALWTCLPGMGFDSKWDFPSPIFLLGLLLCPWMWGISSKLLQHCAATAPTPAILLGLFCPWTWGISSQLFQCHTGTTPAPTILLGLLCPWMWASSSQLLQRHASTAPDSNW